MMASLSKLGVIGAGNMGSAIVRGVLSDDTGLTSVHVFDVDETAAQALSEDHGAVVESSVDSLVEAVDFIVLAVKPDVVSQVLSSISGNQTKVASIAAGVELKTLQSNLPAGAETIRVMPNTPAQIGEGMSFVAPGDNVSDSFLDALVDVFESVGEVLVVDEKKMDTVTALSGSGPAYVFYFLEAMAEAGVYLGLDSEQARKAAEQTMLGAAKLASERDDAGPAELRSEVSSPGGTTVEAIKHLDEQGVKGTIEEAINRAKQKSESLGTS